MSDSNSVGRVLTQEEILELIARMIKEEQEKNAKLLALIEEIKQEPN